MRIRDIVSEARAYGGWISPDGTYHDVPKEQHATFIDDMGYTVDDELGYQEAFLDGWVRIVLDGMVAGTFGSLIKLFNDWYPLLQNNNSIDVDVSAASDDDKKHIGKFVNFRNTSIPNMISFSLELPKDRNLARRIFSNRINEVTRPKYWDAFHLLQKAGWQQLDDGGYSNVLHHPDKDYIVKLVSDDVAYWAFLRAIGGSQNPYWPRFRGKPVRLRSSDPEDTNFAVRMEKLREITNTEYVKFAGDYRYGADPDIVEAKAVIDKLKKRFRLDMKRDNIMVRPGDGHFVIIDPVKP